MSRSHVSEFWDARARENALFYVDTRQSYGRPDPETFWARGEADLDTMFGLLEVRLAGWERVLDIGCGVGRLTRVLAARAREVVGIDVSAEMLARAQAHHPHLTNVSWVLGDGTSLQPVASASIDVCVSCVVFQHIPEPAVTLGYIREMGRVLRPGGWTAFQISTLPDLHDLERWRRTPLQRVADRLLRRPQGQDDPAWVGSAVDLAELRRVAEEAGLAVERVTHEGTQFCGVRARRLS